MAVQRARHQRRCSTYVLQARGIARGAVCVCGGGVVFTPREKELDKGARKESKWRTIVVARAPSRECVSI